MRGECRDLRDGEGRSEVSASSRVVGSREIEYGTREARGDTCTVCVEEWEREASEKASIPGSPDWRTQAADQLMVEQTTATCRGWIGAKRSGQWIAGQRDGDAQGRAMGADSADDERDTHGERIISNEGD